MVFYVYNHLLGLANVECLVETEVEGGYVVLTTPIWQFLYTDGYLNDELSMFPEGETTVIMGVVNVRNPSLVNPHFLSPV